MQEFKNKLLFAACLVFLSLFVLFLVLYLHERKERTSQGSLKFTNYFVKTSKNAASTKSLESGSSSRRGGDGSQDPHPFIPGIQVGFLRNLNSSHHYTDQDVDFILNKINEHQPLLGTRLATENEIMQEHIRPLQSFFWYLKDPITQEKGTGTKYNTRNWRPQKYRSSPDMAITMMDNNFLDEDFLRNQFQLEYIPGSI